MQVLPSKKITVQPNTPPTLCCGRSQVINLDKNTRCFGEDKPMLTTSEQDFHSGSYQDEELVQDIGREVRKIKTIELQ